ncbi:MAG: hypothetical protein A3H32_14395 [Betaproteobacteria bacterium RIFCSPLOWO2_02_FULL_63_19]|nr:MAG: hypothetical protein A3H32_14395 [Betaproteobacteria bacterium RIFCSPLOWO2_02_FULL_63_19]
MLNILATGTLVADPQRRTSAKGATYATASLRVPSDGADAVLVSLICFATDAVDALLAHAKGDALAVAGRAKLSSWTGRDGAECHGLAVTAERVLSPYMLDKKRTAARESEEVTA